ncbi:DNA-binding transcriptional regulator, MarR family [Halobacillus karajensis]|uniref:Transcriptional regulator SlyA n=1 Tax=Halobacillus karajensis TaxID=195088 RepID=A0A024P4Z8_9BACI|nr:MarR family transcriptional regulator [Halobacillus karajensis]CDQ20571.1 Transcriptional regulator SlyA [Halobacillus karajensis]CDQ23960.1 Transcriptional regulator SlyA [Halobacillus karajensis]CDQ27438.1 Transcriptional regulator SlyA [Halobacillus karajensis]SEH89531.1 DNA-binding transcriptional regulator, MarR family [Halobacillus karajensis]
MNLSFQDYISIKLHQTDLKLTSYIKSQLHPYNLAPEQNLIMMLLWEKDGLNQNQLAQYLGKDKTNIARMASNLESKGFIKRNFCTEDRRSLELYLTEKGQELKEQVVPVAESFNEKVTEGISKDELLEFDRLLTKMQNNIEG